MSNAPSAAAAVETGAGFLEISEKGFGFLRSSDNHFQPKPSDIFVTPDTIKKNFLREGCHVAGTLQPPHRGNSPQLRAVEGHGRVGGQAIQEIVGRAGLVHGSLHLERVSAYAFV